MKPVIIIYTDQCHKANLNELIWGIEEQGVLFEVSSKTINSEEEAEALSKQAALISNLDIGICQYNDLVIVYTKSLIQFRPLFKDSRHVRKIGMNTARHVKGLAFDL
jgi:hypothetical protein